MKKIFAIVALLSAVINTNAQTEDGIELLADPFPQVDRQPCMINFAPTTSANEARPGMRRSNMKQQNAPLGSKGSPEIPVILANFSDEQFQDPSTATDDNGYARYFRGTLSE